MQLPDGGPAMTVTNPIRPFDPGGDILFHSVNRSPSMRQRSCSSSLLTVAGTSLSRVTQSAQDPYDT